MKWILDVVSRVIYYRLGGGIRAGNYVPEGARIEGRRELGKVGLARKFQAAMKLGMTVRTRAIKVPHWAYCRRFCGVWVVDAVTFVDLGAKTEEDKRLRLKGELEVLVEFAQFVVLDPRMREKRNYKNSVTYAEKVL